MRLGLTLRATVAATFALFSSKTAAFDLQRNAIGLEAIHVEDGTASASGLALTGLVEFTERLGDDESSDLFVSLEGRTTLGDSRFDAYDVRELLLSRDVGALRVQGGIGRVFWGVAESRRLVNIVNQTDLRFDSSGLTALGQPMLSATYAARQGEWRALALPCHRELAQSRAGGRSPAVTPTRCDRLDHALRYSTTRGPLDLGLVYFDGKSRVPAHVDGKAIYPVMHRVSLDMQLTVGAWLFKFEGARDALQDSPARRASVVGTEYTLPGVESGREYGLLYEHLEDTVCTPGICGDVLGLRVTANDVAGSELLVSTLKDRATGDLLISLRAQRRIGERLKLRIDAQRFGDISNLNMGISVGF